NVATMREALNLLVGTHDYSSFRAAGGAPNMSPVRTIYAAELVEEKLFGDDCLTIKIHASGLLYHMARNIVALIVDVGRDRTTLDDFRKIFDARDRNLVPATAPAQGLCLQEVFYTNWHTLTE
ncbi:MAG: tRNA pseudouridine(38-40) synthase TruA, partial [Selenomonadaceae bacterium]|nr:tRNA pseudouridine(38-40) synthase TruA [Selenomonadaceae bacterium]